ncbi:hypothetical protein [Mycobacterium ostraviense]|uniref:Uncharacterized protein n=1 Tax=Mycobacterium ostraviense TaxID=2738409 RepID=A0A162DDF2_9MYCO|nr:hypothetical protein [Mycobacterium ostraviense]KZS65994.1 hypothetical protein A4G28_15655 [Mycobacterium ostraviense]UGT91116.1 hypothetical protein LTS72_23360 [Mycobacterium ostraviense]
MVVRLVLARELNTMVKDCWTRRLMVTGIAAGISRLRARSAPKVDRSGGLGRRRDVLCIAAEWGYHRVTYCDL